MRKTWVITIGVAFSLVIVSSAIIPIIFPQPFENKWTYYVESGMYQVIEELEICGGLIRLEAELWQDHSIELFSNNNPRCSLAIFLSEVYCIIGLERVWIINEYVVYSTTASRIKLVENNEFALLKLISIFLLNGITIFIYDNITKAFNNELMIIGIINIIIFTILEIGIRKLFPKKK